MSIDNCTRHLKNLQTKFKQLLISSMNSNLELSKLKEKLKRDELKNMNEKEQIQNLINKGFSPAIVKRVAYQMSRSGRPSNHYTKREGKLKK